MAWVSALLAVFLSAILVGYAGFGFNLLATPMLAMLVPARDAVIVALVVGTFTNLVLSFLFRKHVQVRVLVQLLLASFPGIVLGALIFATVPVEVLKTLIGALTVTSAIILMIRQPTRRLSNNLLGLVTMSAGFVSGTLTATTGMGGPPVVIRLMMLLSNAPLIRATLVAYTAVVSMAALSLLGLSHETSLGQLLNAAYLTPTAITGLAIGLLAFRLRPAYYKHVVIGTLILVGVSGMIVTLK